MCGFKLTLKRQIEDEEHYPKSIFDEPFVICTVISLKYTDMAQLKGFDW